MSDISEEWKKIRQELGNFMCKLDNAANRAIATDEQRKKVYDAAFESGWVNGRNDLWDTIDDYFSIASDGQRRHKLATKLGHTSFDEIVGTMSPDSFSEGLKAYHEDAKKAQEMIEPGDECHYISTDKTYLKNRFIVTRIYEGENVLKQKIKFFDAVYHDGRTLTEGTLKLIAKTGNYYPVLHYLASPFDEQSKEDKKDGSV